jgi:thiamine-phosphate pyrophosphorylase
MEHDRVLRILDANLDRVREGLRVIEEWFRFADRDRQCAEECKALRQLIATTHTEAMRERRDTPGDPLTAVDHPSEGERHGVADLLRVNFARVQEGLRVVEEYAKLVEPTLATAAKQWRYRVYTLESTALGHDRRKRLAEARLYLVSAPHPDLLAVVEAALRGGLRLVQLREKDAEGLAVLELAHRLRDLTLRYGALLIINDRVDLAMASGADGVHLGQGDLPVAVARSLMGPRAIIGRSTHQPAEAERAVAEGADYIGIGPVFTTPTKPGRPAVGFEYVRFCREQISLPGYAIGGIDLDNLDAVLAAGAERVSVVRAIMAADDPERVTARFLEKLHAH